MSVKFKKQFFLLVSLSVLVFLFQNCGGSFEANELSSIDGSGTEACRSDLLESYKQSVKTVFISNNCTSCHSKGGIAESTAFDFSFGKSDEEVLNGLSKVINLSDPSKSKLLTKPSNQVFHAGGELITLGSSDYIRLNSFVNLVSSSDFCNSISVCDFKSSLNKKKVRRLSQSQIRSVIEKAYAGFYFPVDYTMFFESIPSLGFTNDSGRLTVDAIALDRWRANFEGQGKRNAFQFYAAPSECRYTITEECLEATINKYSLSLLRRPLLSDEKADLKARLDSIVSNGANVQWQWTFVHMYFLMHPSFFYRTEIGLNEASLEDIVELDDYEIASFLSFSIVDGPPDQKLLDKAREGLLKDKVELALQVERLFAMPEANQSLVKYIKDLLKLNKIVNAPIDKYTNFALRRSRIEGVQWTELLTRPNSLDPEIDDQIKTDIGSNLEYMNIFSGQTFAVTKSSAPLYGVEYSEMQSDYPSDRNEIVYKRFSADEREGILTHPAFLSVHSNENNNGMIKRGVFMLEQLLCHEMPSAPADIPSLEELPVGFDPTTLTSREKLEIMHSSQQSCAFCHQSIDNIGGGLENYSNVGSFNLTETFTINNTAYTLDIIASGELSGIGDIDISFNNSVDMIRKVTASSGFKSCMNQRLLEYVSGEEKEESNSCAFSSHDEKLKKSSDKTFKSFINNLINTETFLKRKRGESHE